MNLATVISVLTDLYAEGGNATVYVEGDTPISGIGFDSVGDVIIHLYKGA